MLHAGHSVRQFGENISLQIQFCAVIEGFFTSTMSDLIQSVFSQDGLSCLFSYLSAQRRLKRICQRGTSSCFEPKWWNGCCGRHCPRSWRRRLGRKQACSLTDLQREERGYYCSLTQQHSVCNLKRLCVNRFLKKKQNNPWSNLTFIQCTSYNVQPWLNLSECALIWNSVN